MSEAKREDRAINDKTELAYASGKPKSILYKEALFRNPAALWWTMAAILGWIFSRPGSKKREVVAPLFEEKYSVPKTASKYGGIKKKRLNLVSMGFELVVAVGMNLLSDHVKTWVAEINASSKKPTKDPDPAVRENDPSVQHQLKQVNEQLHPKENTGKKGPWMLLKTTAVQWMNDKCPQLGAALAYFTVFSLAPLVLVLLAVFGLFYGGTQAREKITEQLQYLIDPSGIKVIQDIAASASKPQSGILATVVGVVVGVFGASGVFGQLQEALNTIWGVKAKPGTGLVGFLRARFLSFGMVGGVCFLLLVSLTVESLLRGLSGYLQNLLPGGNILSLLLFLVLDIGMVILLFAMIFRFLPDVKIAWRDVWMGASLTAILFVIGKFGLGLYLGSGAAGSAYGAASSLITLLLWIYYSAQILLFGAEFTQVYANTYGSRVEPEKHAIRVKRIEVEVPRPA